MILQFFEDTSWKHIKNAVIDMCSFWDILYIKLSWNINRLTRKCGRWLLPRSWDALGRYRCGPVFVSGAYLASTPGNQVAFRAERCVDSAFSRLVDSRRRNAEVRRRLGRSSFPCYCRRVHRLLPTRRRLSFPLPRRKWRDNVFRRTGRLLCDECRGRGRPCDQAGLRERPAVAGVDFRCPAKSSDRCWSSRRRRSRRSRRPRLLRCCRSRRSFPAEA